MEKSTIPGDMVLLRGACLWIGAALVLAWCLVGLNFQIPVLHAIFPGKFHRVVQAHIDFLLMSALILGLYATRVSFKWHTSWAIVIGAFTNSSLFLLMAVFPELDGPPDPTPSLLQQAFLPFLLASVTTTSYGFGSAVRTVFMASLGRS